MAFLQNLFEQSNLPLLSAFILGLMTALSPCPMATNITAIGYIGKNVTDQTRVFKNGIIYTVGRALSYSVLGLLFYFGSNQFEISGFLQKNGEHLLIPFLIIIGLLMLDVIKIKLFNINVYSEKIGQLAQNSYWGALVLGMAFALAFCPYSAVLYFGILIPMTIASTSGLYLPVIFAVATGIPVILFAWILAFSLNKIGGIYANIKKFEVWFRRIIGTLFILVGFYYLLIWIL